MVDPSSRVLSSSQFETLAAPARNGPRRSARCSSRSATRPTRSSRSSRARPRSSTPPGDEIVRHGAVRLPRRDEPALRADRLPHRRRHRADALHRGRARGAAAAALRRRLALGPPALGLRRSGAKLLQQREGIGIEIIGPRDSSEETRRLRRLRRSAAPPAHLARPGRRATEAAALVERLDDDELPLVRLPGGAELRRPSQRRALAGARDRARARAARGGRPARRRRRPGRPRRRRLRRLGGPRHAGGREHRARRPGRHVAADRELPRLPGRDQRHRADQPRDHPGAQVRRPHRDALPGARARARRATATSSSSTSDIEVAAQAVLLATGAEYRRLPVEDLDEYEGFERLLRGRPARGAALRRAAGRRRRRRQLGRAGGDLARPRRRPRHPAAPPRRPAARRCRTT